ncbi:hypothetical protein EV702DRAFT_1221096 [Suillus placidus]|uniref:Uncharacterized protein n=1 Tax=Suillus placidus TaxID=48579 RepID=A0A9P6ZFC9_9AGAM|nr:hypothetical protein EV702DRAFT_1221096 [Suillus placidus]
MHRSLSMAACEPSFEGQPDCFHWRVPGLLQVALLLFASREQGQLQGCRGYALARARRCTVALLVGSSGWSHRLAAHSSLIDSSMTGLVFHWTAKYPSQDWDAVALIQVACSHCAKLAPGVLKSNVPLARDDAQPEDTVTLLYPFGYFHVTIHTSFSSYFQSIPARCQGGNSQNNREKGTNPSSSNASFGPSPPPSSPLSSRVTAMSTVSETDPEDNFPPIPDSKHSGGAYHHFPGTSRGAKFQLGRPQADHDNQLGAPDSKPNDVFLRYMDGLSPTSCRYVVHYKEAVRECQCMRLFTTYWELEETNKLRTLLMSLYAEADLEFRRAELESQVLLKALVTKQSLSCSAADVEYLTAIRQCNKTSLREADTQLDLLKDHLKQKQSIHKLDDTSNCAADGQIVADDYHIASLALTPTGIGQPLVGKIYPNHGDGLLGIDPTLMLLRQPSSSQHAHNHQHATDVQPHVSGSAPQPSDLLPPANVPIYCDRNDADSQHRYDPSTNPYSHGMPAMPTPSPWRVYTPPPLFDNNQLLPANRQFYENISSPFAGNLALGDDLPPLPLNHASSDSMHDPFNLEAPLLMCPPYMNNPASQMPDDIANIEPTRTMPSNVVSVTPHYPPAFLSAFIPEFTQPVLSKGRDVLLPPDVDDEPIRELFKDMAIPEGGSTFLFYGGLNDRRGRKGKCGAKYMVQSHLIYDENNRVHKHIIRSAKKEITKDALNVSSLSDEADRSVLVERKLEQAARRYMQTQGTEWASHNSGTLYLILSDPCRNIMQSCRKHACNLVVDRFGLRLSIWSNASECEHQETVIAHFLDDHVFPPRYVMGQGTDGMWYFLENPVVLNIILDTIRELKLERYLEDLDSLGCTAAVAICFALEKIRDRTSSDVEFSGTAFKVLHKKLMDYIETTIQKCPILRKRWEDYKKAIKIRLTPSPIVFIHIRVKLSHHLPPTIIIMLDSMSPRSKSTEYLCVTAPHPQHFNWKHLNEDAVQTSLRASAMTSVALPGQTALDEDGSCNSHMQIKYTRKTLPVDTRSYRLLQLEECLGKVLESVHGFERPAPPRLLPSQNQQQHTPRPGSSLGLNSARIRCVMSEKVGVPMLACASPLTVQSQYAAEYARHAVEEAPKPFPQPANRPPKHMSQVHIHTQTHHQRDSDTVCFFALNNLPTVSSPTVADRNPGRLSPSARNVLSSQSQGHGQVYHRQNPTAPKPPTTSGLLAPPPSASKLKSGKTWAAGDEPADSEPEEEHKGSESEWGEVDD